MEIAARLDVIRPATVFAGLTQEELRGVARAARERPLKKGDPLFAQGAPAHDHFLIAWGRLRLDQITADGQNVVLRFLGPGELVGSVAVLRGAPYPATPTALEDSLLLTWGAETFTDLMERYPRIGMNAVKLVGGRIEELQARLAEIATQRVERRIAATLLRMVKQSGRRVEGGVEIPFAVSRAEIAEMTATTLHTVSRTLSAWEQEGILTGKRSAHLVIAKPHRLVEIAEQA